MANAYGFVEITGVAAATSALDIMCKTADVRFVTWERKLGGRLVTFGSDAHFPNALGRGFDYARQMALDCGISEYAIYMRGEPVMRRL